MSIFMPSVVGITFGFLAFVVSIGGILLLKWGCQNAQNTTR